MEIRTYRPIEKQKEFCGILNAYDSNSVTIDEDGTERTFDKNTITARMEKARESKVAAKKYKRRTGKRTGKVCKAGT